MQNIKAVLLNKRFLAFYWSAGIFFVLSFLNMVMQNITEFGLSETEIFWATLIVREMTKALSNLAKGETL